MGCEQAPHERRDSGGKSERRTAVPVRTSEGLTVRDPLFEEAWQGWGTVGREVAVVAVRLVSVVVWQCLPLLRGGRGV